MTLGTDGDIALQNARVERDQHARTHASPANIGDVDRRRIPTIQLGQSRTRVRQTDAFPRSPTVGRREPLSGVTYRELDMQSNPPRSDPKLGWPGSAANAVA